MEEQQGRTKQIVVAVVLVALAAIAGYRWWSTSEPDIVPIEQSVSDFLVDWECLDCGERFETNAGAGPRKCAKCGKDSAYAAISWGCPTHGVRPVFFQYDAKGQPSQIRFKGGEWQPAISPEGSWNTKCPACGIAMFPADSVRPAPSKPGSN